MKELTFSIYHHDCWGSRITEKDEYVTMETLASPVVQRTGKYEFLDGIWHVGLERGESLNDVIKKITCFKSSSVANIKVDFLRAPDRGGVDVMIGARWEHGKAAIGRVLDNRCVMLEPVKTFDGREHYRVASTEPRRIKNLLAELESIGELKIHRIGDIDLKSGMGDLTQKQMQALELAVDLNYYSWPRKVTVDELARAAGVSRVTFLNHLRKAEMKVLPGYIRNILMPELDLATYGVGEFHR